MELFKISKLTGMPHVMTIPLTEQAYGYLYNQWKNENRLIQDVFCMLNEDEREFIMNGITPEEWKATWMAYDDYQQEEKNMIVSELLKLLEDLPPDTQVMVWQDGERSSIDSVDWWTDDCVDFNVKGERQ